jgi:hypothetical protein
MNCAMSGGYGSKKINKSDKIIQELKIKGIYENNNYFIIPVNMGEFKLYTVKYQNNSISPLFDNLQEAINVFLKLTND